MPMLSEKQIKAEFRKKAQEEPEKYYPVEALVEEGFSRKKCSRCGNHFWSAADRDVCGEPECSGGYTFIGESPAKVKMDFIEVWKRFSKQFEGFGYAPIPRYPVVARWRDDTDFVQASIYDFQPYCVSGEISPPANPLVVPQFCLRFNDTDNVGITGRHYTGFVMIGQHAFESPDSYAPKEYLEHIYLWLIDGMKLPKEEIQFHEDVWAGGGNMGPSMEFFSRGLEIGNQVYMQYDIKSSEIKELDIKVLDMGMGQERPAWFTHGTHTSYEANFPSVAERLYKTTGISPNLELVESFLPYSGMLSIDEVEDIDAQWRKVAEAIGIGVKELKDEVVPLSGIYSIGDHTRSLLLALSDGGLPSNVGGGYNLRVLVRRSLDFIKRYEWDISLAEVCGWHARYLKPQYPELTENLEEVAEILEVEEKRYEETGRKSRKMVSRLRAEEVSLEKLIELYDSNGISPEMLCEAGLDIVIPEDFYMRVAERHERAEQRAQTRKVKEVGTGDVGNTRILYYDNYLDLEFKAKVLKVVEGRYVVLDETSFYPTSGGQMYDTGTLNGRKVVDVFKQDRVVVHDVKSPDFKRGDTVTGSIDEGRRRQLAQHHTATHIVNGAAREILGNHIWQAGAEKTLEKARLDITHYESLSDDRLGEIERRANEIVGEDIPVESSLLSRDVAEAQYGFRLYQGGAVPGREIRVVRIDDIDTEACGGTHLKRTGEAGLIKIIGSTKIQDGIVRLEYVAGEAAEKYISESILDTYARMLKLIIDFKGFPSYKDRYEKRLAETERVLGKPEDFGKNFEYITLLDRELREAEKFFKVSREQLEGTLKRFIKEIHDFSKEVGARIVPFHDVEKAKTKPIEEVGKLIFEMWKRTKKDFEKVKGEAAKERAEEFGEFEKIKDYEVLVGELEGDAKEVLKVASELVGEKRVVVLFGRGKRIAVVGIRGGKVEIDMGGLVSKACAVLGGGGGGKPDFAQGAGRDASKLEDAREFVRKELKEKL